MMTRRAIVLGAATALLALSGCARSPKPVTVQSGRKTLSVEVFQDGRKLSPVGGVWRLKAAPFEFGLSGDLRWASYHAAGGDELARKLAALDRPLVFFAATTSPAEGARLYVFRGRAESDEATELFTADERFFSKQWGSKEPEARELAARLRKEFGSAPAIASFGHFPFPSGGAGEAPRYFLGDATRDGERSSGRFRVESIRAGPVARPPAAGQRVQLLIFLESPIDRDFRRTGWSRLILEFESEGPTK
jgi:hypothetical protein